MTACMKLQDLEILLTIFAFFGGVNDPSQTVATARIAFKNLPGPALTFGSHCSRFHSNRFTFGGAIAERVKTVFAP